MLLNDFSYPLTHFQISWITVQGCWKMKLWLHLSESYVLQWTTLKQHQPVSIIQNTFPWKSSQKQLMAVVWTEMLLTFQGQKWCINDRLCCMVCVINICSLSCVKSKRRDSSQRREEMLCGSCQCSSVSQRSFISYPTLGKFLSRRWLGNPSSDFESHKGYNFFIWAPFSFKFSLVRSCRKTN